MKKLILPIFLALPAFAQELELAWQIDIPIGNTLGMSLGDIDGDGDLDAFNSNGVTNSHLLANDGSGKFSLLENQPTFPSGGASAFGDIDGDGDLDLVASAFFSPCAVYINDGGGGFTDSGQAVGVSSFREQIFLSDLDGDTDLDLVLTTNDSSHPNEIWLNNGSGVFTDTGQNLGSLFTISAALGDIDNDGDPDLVMGNNGNNTVWINDGAGTFTQGTSLTGIGTTIDIAMADLDGDTDLDVFVANGSIGGQTNQVHLNNGSGVFTLLAQPNFTSNFFHSALHLSDFDNDGDVDALVGLNRAETNQIWSNNGSGVFSITALNAGPGGAFRITPGDVDGDSDIDLMLGTDGIAPRALLRTPLGQGGPFITSQDEIGGSQASSVASADFDMDGDLDIVLGNIGGTVTLLINDGSGEFDDPGVVYVCSPGNNASQIVTGDLDGINGPDFVVFCTQYSGQANGQDEIFLNNGSGGFTKAPTQLDDYFNGAIAIGDIDGDNDLDIVTVNMVQFGRDGQNSIHRNNGSGVFTREDAFGTGSQRSVALLDVDGDSDLDVYIGGVDSGDPLLDTDDTLWLNNGSGIFTDSGQSLGTGSPTSVISADFNGDSDPDIFYIDPTNGNRLWLNNGSGLLTSSGVSIGSSFTNEVKAFDYDGDTDLDLWFAKGGFGPSPDNIMINDGAGNFTLSPDSYANIASAGVVIADFTGDSSLDAFVGSNLGTHQLWVADPSPVSLWAAGFSLTGNDALPNADPDGDLLPNFLEMAYNLNPGVADAAPMASITATSGTPLTEYNPLTNQFKIVTIQRKNSTFIEYEAQTSSNLLNFSKASNVSVSTTNLGASNYRRATITFSSPTSLERNFARLRTTYDP